MMYHKNPPVYACAVCGKKTFADMLFGYEGDDVCSDCLEILQDTKEREQFDSTFDNAQVERCKRGWG